MTAAEELAVIKKVLSGDRAAFEVLYNDNQRRVYGLALKMTKSPDDALDISQEAFLKAYSSLASFRGESRFSVWLYRLTYNLCVDLVRRRTRVREVSLAIDDADGDEMEIPDMRALPEDEALRRETRDAIAAGVSELSDKHREILIMREVTGMGYGDIASTLGISDGTVKSRLSRARLALSGILMTKGTFPDGHRLKSEKEVEKND